MSASPDATIALDRPTSSEAGSPERTPLLKHPAPVAVISFALAALAFSRYSLGGGALVAAFMAAVLVVVAATDIERRIIPNRIVLPATAIVLLAHIAISPGRTSEFVLAGLAASAVFMIPNLINRSAMGMGDVKLVLLLGVGLGSGVLTAVTIAFLTLFPVALGTLIRGGLAARKTTLPFGPFLALGGLIVLLFPHLVAAA